MNLFSAPQALKNRFRPFVKEGLGRGCIGMKENLKYLLLALMLLLPLASADPLTIPTSQPICNLYGIIQVLGTVAGVIVAAYGGFILASSHDLAERNTAKALLSGVVLGLIVIWIAPLLVKNLVGASSVCGW
ncbi:MAG: hypothetical protein HZA83_01200 [Thaumarchaeota archaeon]|nr:hypothetical protein [Nitrososphaerota archaeon]